MIKFKEPQYKYKFTPVGILDTTDGETYPMADESDVVVAREYIPWDILDAWVRKYVDDNFDLNAYEAFLHAMEKDD